MRERWVDIFHSMLCTGEHGNDPDPMCEWFARRVYERCIAKELRVVDVVDLARGNGILRLYSEATVDAM